VDQFKLLTFFPGGYINDLSSYLAQLYFLDTCGFHQFCSYWYNGFTAFLITPPGWYFFTYPLYLLFGDVKIAAYASIILILVLSYVVIHYFGKKLKIQPLYRILFFLLVFANVNSIRSFLRSGRPHELLGWFLFLLLFFIVLYYKDKKITLPFYTTTLVYSALILTYFSVAIYGGLLFLGLFLYKKTKEKIQVIFAVLVGILLSSFWLVPFLTNIKETFIETFYAGQWLLEFTKLAMFKQLGATIFPLIFLVLFYISWKEQHKNKRYFLFYSPFLTLAVLLFFRITAFLPIFKNIPPTQYFTLFIVLAAYLLITLKSLHKLLLYALGLAAIGSVVITLFFTAYYEVQNQDTQDILELLPHIEERYMAIGLSPKEVYSKPLTAYAAIYYDLDNALGWYPHVKEQSYFEEIDKLQKAFNEQNCEEIIEQLEVLNTQEVLTHIGCSFLTKCGLDLKAEKHDYCVYSI
tara:strand:+ start:2436 stop:3827 length:1392 start_codon:yes stop_codon:yes gene_type:complete